MDNQNHSDSSEEPQEISIRAVKRKDVGPVAKKKIARKSKPKVQISQQLRQIISQKLNTVEQALPTIRTPAVEQKQEGISFQQKQSMTKKVKGVEIVYKAKKYPAKTISLVDKMRRLCDHKRSKPSIIKHLKRK